MSVVLHPRFADQPGKLRVWIGVTGRTTAPALAWRLNGKPAQPKPIRTIASVRTAGMLQGNPNRAFAGLYEFDAGGPATHRISVQVDAQSASTVVRKFADTLPVSLDQWFNVLLVSCYDRGEARLGAITATLDRVRKQAPPHMTVLMGDQVYLDLPSIKDFKDDKSWLAARFEGNYLENWMGQRGFSEILGMAPSVSIPDDHEYWNNAPHWATAIQNSWRKESRDTWKEAASTMFQAFQAPSPDSVRKPYEVDLSLVSFLFADGRSAREANMSRAFHGDALTRIKDWVKKLNDKRMVGVFATGQPVLAGKARELSGRFGDWALANYGDHAELLKILGECKQSLVLLTGDVHWSRVAHAKRVGAGKVCDVVVSPAALVATPAVDQARRAWNWVAGLANRGERWPRHSNADPPARGVKLGPGAPIDFSSLLGGEDGQGDRVAVVQFRNHGGKVHARVHYWHVQSEAETPKTVNLLP